MSKEVKFEIRSSTFKILDRTESPCYSITKAFLNRGVFIPLCLYTLYTYTPIYLYTSYLYTSLQNNGSMFDMMKMMGKMKEVQARIKEAQDNLVNITATGEAGGGMVKAT